MSRALVVAHGQPSDPQPAAAELAALTGRIAALLPDWRLASATLAEEGALPAAVARLPPRPGDGPLRVFPLFMAGGWFTTKAIPERLAAAGAGNCSVLPPFGALDSITALALDLVAESGTDEVLLAAHGSFKSQVPAAVAQALAARIVGLPGIRRAEAAFIDQMPQLSSAKGFGPRAICLPFFAMAGGHVTTDLPRALETAGFPGRILPPLGLDPRVPGLIAAALGGPRS